MPGGAIDEPTRARCDQPAPTALREAIEQFNRGEFFEQHETLETLWRATRTPDRDLYHGILQIGVAFHHWGKSNHHGASVLLDEGIARLRPFAPSCQGVDVAALIDGASSARDRLRALSRDDMASVDITSVAPRIRFVPVGG